MASEESERETYHDQLWYDETFFEMTRHTISLSDEPSWKRISNEEYVEMMREQARLSAEFEASNRRIQELLTDAMTKERTND